MPQNCFLTRIAIEDCIEEPAENKGSEKSPHVPLMIEASWFHDGEAACAGWTLTAARAQNFDGELFPPTVLDVPEKFQVGST